jgi:hypothetical protein
LNKNNLLIKKVQLLNLLKNKEVIIVVQLWKEKNLIRIGSTEIGEFYESWKKKINRLYIVLNKNNKSNIVDYKN